MKITVVPSFNPNRTEIETQGTTLGSLLDELSRQYKPADGDDFYDSDTGEVFPDCDVVLNGKSYRVIPDGLNAELKDGDKLEIIQLFMLVGG